ncbi:MAG TPA: DNA recombination protein RmuC [Burkholderiales bacterium]|nr:DNA recombination protein RmuC [Burkholderiales bacterium]
MDVSFVVAVLLLAAMLVLLLARGASQARDVRELRARLSEMSERLSDALESKHRGMLVDLHSGLTQQGDRLGGHLTESSERLRAAVADELKQTRDTVHALKLSLERSMGEYREAMLARLGETTQTLNARIDQRLSEISGKVNERLDDGFRKTNETFVNVMSRLATIDEAQKKIESLTGSVVSLQELLGDKRARGAFGEVQLEGLVRNVLPTAAYEMQATLSTGARADCVLKLPAPTGKIAIDSKFPLENYHRMFSAEANDIERAAAQKQFRADLRRHIDAICTKYIVPGETSNGAVMFIPAEAVFAEIHAHHAEVVDYAMTHCVWIVSPTTLMAVLNTARAVLKDVETRRHIHIIKDCLGKLAVDFNRFDERMKDLARHIRQAHEDVENVQISSKKISQRFAQIEAAELGELDQPSPPLRIVEARDEGKA